MMRSGISVRLGVSIMLAAAIFVLTSEYLKSAPRQSVRSELQVALPLFVQVFMSMGDRNLAANIASIRALVVETQKMTPDEFAILAKVQEDIAWLNPGHEDNYYIAAAILPWVGQVDAAQHVLARASVARRYDYQPAFYYGFNQLHFRNDAAGASAWLREAAEHLPDGPNKIQMQNLAAIWMDKAPDIDTAIKVVEALAEQSKRQDFKRYLEMRVQRLQTLKALRVAASSYRQQHGRPPTALQDLVATGHLAVLPDDPFGFGYDIDTQGEIILRNSPAPQRK